MPGERAELGVDRRPARPTRRCRRRPPAARARRTSATPLASIPPAARNASRVLPQRARAGAARGSRRRPRSRAPRRRARGRSAPIAWPASAQSSSTPRANSGGIVSVPSCGEALGRLHLRVDLDAAVHAAGSRPGGRARRCACRSARPSRAGPTRSCAPPPAPPRGGGAASAARPARAPATPARRRSAAARGRRRCAPASASASSVTRPARAPCRASPAGTAARRSRARSRTRRRRRRRRARWPPRGSR